MPAYSLLRDRFVMVAPTVVEVPGDLLEAIEEQIRTTPPAASKDALPWIKLAVFGNKRSAKGSYRHDANVVRLHGVEVDYDNGHSTNDQAAHAGRTIEWARDRLAKVGVRALLYSTASSTAEAPRWRVLCDLAEPVEGDTSALRMFRRQMVARVNHVLEGCLTAESFALSQSYYFGPVIGKPMEVCHAY
jgi:hypothetical protein